MKIDELISKGINSYNEIIKKAMKDEQIKETFEKLLQEFNENISISEDEVFEMIIQYIITKPIFKILFPSVTSIEDSFIFQKIEFFLKYIDKEKLLNTEKMMEEVYVDIQIKNKKAIDAKTKQEIIIEFYNTLLKFSNKKTAENLGIVFTPVEIVDFIIYSVNELLIKYFNKNLNNKEVKVLDPFTGTGTFIVRLLQSGLIDKENLLRKYMKEIQANEIVLLSYCIAMINIEETLNSLLKCNVSFNGISLTDTFKEMKKQDGITVIIGNPPYFVGQKSANDNNQKGQYIELDEKIRETYAKYSNSNLNKGLYDSYIRAFRWASNRIGKQGIIGFVTNASFIDSQSTSGVRKCWYEEFNYIYVFNLRGNKRTLGKKSLQEGEPVFGSGSRVPIAITLLVKDGSDNHKIYYHDIGDYLSRNKKLSIISEFKSINGIGWTEIEPDYNNDWINIRDISYEKFLSMDGDFFLDRAIGVSTNRDVWVYSFSKKNLKITVHQLIENFNLEVMRLSNIANVKEKLKSINTSPEFIKWSDGLKTRLKSGNKIIPDDEKIIISMYRPFNKKFLYYQPDLIERPSRYKDFFGNNNKVIYITGSGASRDFSCLIIDSIPNLDLMEKGQGFYWKNNSENLLNLNLSMIGKLELSEDESLYYVYGILHSSEYREKYKNDLRKSLPRIPILKNKEKYIEIGRKLANLHLNYESVPPYEGVEVIYKKSNPSYKVTKMKHPKKGVFDTIIFNSEIIIKNIPEKAYEYVLNGRSAIGWIMDQYQVKTDKKSGIRDDANLYSEDEKYIFNLLLSIINVSVQTVDLVNSLPPLEIEDSSK